MFILRVDVHAQGPAGDNIVTESVAKLRVNAKYLPTPTSHPVVRVQLRTQLSASGEKVGSLRVDVRPVVLTRAPDGVGTRWGELYGAAPGSVVWTVFEVGRS